MYPPFQKVHAFSKGTRLFRICLTDSGISSGIGSSAVSRVGSIIDSSLYSGIGSGPSLDFRPQLLTLAPALVLALALYLNPALALALSM